MKFARYKAGRYKKRAKKIYKMFFQKGMSLNEIAVKYNISRQRVSQLLHRMASKEKMQEEVQRRLEERKRRKRLIKELDLYSKYGPEWHSIYSDVYWRFSAVRQGKKWSRDWDKCRICGTTRRKHLARGMCMRCYYKYIYWHNPKRREKIKELQRKNYVRRKNKQSVFQSSHRSNTALFSEASVKNTSSESTENQQAIC